MRLAYLANADSIHTRRWATSLAQRGHEVHLFSIEKAEVPGVCVHILPFNKLHGILLNVPLLWGMLKHIRPDLIHAHYAGVYGTMGRLCGFRPYILSVWGSDVYEVPYRSAIYRKLVLANLQSPDWICSTSTVMAEQTLRLFPNVKKLSVIPFGIDTNIFMPRPELKSAERIVLGTVKTLETNYGIDILLRAFAVARDEMLRKNHDIGSRMRLVIVGSGDKKVQLEYLAKRLNIVKITEFTGAISHCAVPAYLNQFQIFLALSRMYESFGVSVLEASACGLPVIVSDVGGLPEVVQDKITGLVVARESVNEAARAIVALLEDESLMSGMGNAGRRLVEMHYSWIRSLDLMELVYCELLGRELRR